MKKIFEKKRKKHIAKAASASEIMRALGISERDRQAALRAMPKKTREEVVYSHTFQELRDWAKKKTKASDDHFCFAGLGSKYRKFWEDMNRVEFERGYDAEEYAKPNTPALYQMKLLTNREFDEWKKRFGSFHQPKT